MGRSRHLPLLVCISYLLAVPGAKAADAPPPSPTPAAAQKVSPPALAPAQKALSPQPAPASADSASGASDPAFGPDDDEPTVPALMTIRVPDSLRNRGLTLLADDQRWPLTSSTLQVQPRLETSYVRLIDRDNRLRTFEYAELGADLFTHIHPSEWLVEIYIGAATVNGQALRALLQNGTLAEENFDLTWQPGAFGIRAGLAVQSSHEQRGSIESQYDATAFRLAATYERRLWADVHGVLFVGGFAAVERINLYDTIVSAESVSKSFGPLAGVDLRYPIIDNFWLSLRGALTYQRVNFKPFAFNHQFVERSVLLGGSYAF